MSRADLREEIHQYIDSADDRVLQLIYGMVQADLTEKEYELNDAHKSILDDRLEKYESGEMSFSSWDSVKKRIRKRAKK